MKNYTHTNRDTQTTPPLPRILRWACVPLPSNIKSDKPLLLFCGSRPHLLMDLNEIRFGRGKSNRTGNCFVFLFLCFRSFGIALHLKKMVWNVKNIHNTYPYIEFHPSLSVNVAWIHRRIKGDLKPYKCPRPFIICCISIKEFTKPPPQQSKVGSHQKETRVDILSDIWKSSPSPIFSILENFPRILGSHQDSLLAYYRTFLAQSIKI